MFLKKFRFLREYSICAYLVQNTLCRNIGKLGIVGKRLTRLVHLDIFQKLKMHLKDERNGEADVVSNFRRMEMTLRQVGVLEYNILSLDDRGDYLLWENQVKGKLRSMGLANVLRYKPTHISNIDWRNSQEHTIYIVIGHLDRSII